MLNSRAAVRYAKAMLEVSQEKSTAAVVNGDMAIIANAIAETPELKTFLMNPLVKGSSKSSALEEVFSSISEDSKRLFNLLKENNRFEILEGVALSYQEQFEEVNGIARVVVTTAVPMDSSLEALVMKKLGELLPGKQAKITNIVDENIIGGFILRIGDKQFNGSIANQLQNLKRELTN